MKVLQVINSLNFGGAEKLLFDTVPKLNKDGLEVDIMVLHDEKTFFFNELEQKHKVTIIRPEKPHGLYNLSHFFWIRKQIKKYNLVHVHLFPCLYWVGVASLFLKNKPKLVFTEHNTENRRRKLALFKYFDKFIYKRYNSIVAISKGVKENLKKHLDQPHRNISLINNGVDTAYFKEAIPYSLEDLAIPQGSKIVIQIASFTPQKDHNTLLKAISLLPKDVHLLLVGNGPLIGEKNKLADDLEISERVHFLGYRNDVHLLLKTADICVLSSHYEGFGISIAEGMATGIPCVGSNVNGLSEVIKDAGILFETGNHIQLKEIIDQLLSDKKYYKKIAKRCENRAQEYDISITVNAQVNLYARLVS